MRPLLVSALVVLSAVPALAHTIEGSVREKGTRAPVPGAVLYVVEGGFETYSDEDGAFVLDLGERAARAQLVTLRVQCPGYAPEVLPVELERGEDTAKLDVYLTPADDIGSTVVRERRSPADRARGAVRIEDREVNELPGTYGDPAKAIENFPGMGRVVLSQGSLFVRGANPGDTAVYVDDFEVPDLYHFTGSTSVINIPFVESVELVPGAFSARYGRATGGLVTVQTRKLPTDDVHGFAKLDVIDGGAYVGIPLSDDAAVGMSARRSWLDAIRWAQRANGGATDEVLLIPTYWDWQLKLDWDVAPGHELVMFAFGSGDRQLYVRDDSASGSPYESIEDSDFGRVSLRYRHVLGGGFVHTLTPVVGYERHVFDEQSGLRLEDRHTLDAQVRDELSWRGDGTRITVGIDGTLRGDFLGFGGLYADEKRRELPSADLEGAVRDRRVDDLAVRGTLALYAEGTFEPLPHLSLTPGVRLDGYWFNEGPEISIEPRFAGSYAVLPGDFGVVLKGAAGVFAQPPSPEDVVAARLHGRRLQAQNAMHLQGGFEQALGDVGALSTTLYAIWRDHVPERAESFPVPSSPFESPVAATGGAFSSGLELLFRLTRTRGYFAWVSYTVARHERRDGPSPTAVPYPYPAAFDTTHLLTTVGQLHLPFGFRVGGRYRMATGMPVTEVVGAVYDADTGLYLPAHGARGRGRFPTFHALDVRVDWSLLLPWLEVDLYADLVNALNLRVEEGRLYSFDYSEYTPRLGLPTIPTVGAKVTF